MLQAMILFRSVSFYYSSIISSDVMLPDVEFEAERDLSSYQSTPLHRHMPTSNTQTGPHGAGPTQLSPRTQPLGRSISLRSLFFSPEFWRASLGQIPGGDGPAGAPPGWIPGWQWPPRELLRAASPHTHCGGIAPGSACGIPGGLELKRLMSR